MGKEPLRFEGHSRLVMAVAFSPDGKRVLSGGYDGINYWDLKSQIEIQHFHCSHPVYNLSFALDGKHAISCEGNGTICVWDLESGRKLRSFTYRTSDWGPGSAPAVAFSITGRQAVFAHSSKLSLWDTDHGRRIRHLKPGTRLSRLLDFINPRGYEWRLHPRTLRMRLCRKDDQAKWITAVVLSRDGLWVLSGGYKRFQIWDAKKGSEILSSSVLSSLACSIAVSHDSQYGLVGCLNGIIHLLELQPLRETRRFTAHRWAVRSVGLSQSARRALSGGDTTVCLWDLVGGHLIQRFEGHSGEVNCVAFSPDDRLGISASDDKTVRIWQLPE